MVKRFILVNLFYLGALALYFGLLQLTEKKFHGFDVLIFDYPRYSTILFVCFLIIVVFNLISNPQILERPKLSINFTWMPFLLFLIVVAVTYFPGFTLIGAPFRYNIFLNLLIPHLIAFFTIKEVMKKIN